MDDKRPVPGWRWTGFNTCKAGIWEYSGLGGDILYFENCFLPMYLFDFLPITGYVYDNDLISENDNILMYSRPLKINKDSPTPSQFFRIPSGLYRV